MRRGPLVMLRRRPPPLDAPDAAALPTPTHLHYRFVLVADSVRADGRSHGRRAFTGSDDFRYVRRVAMANFEDARPVIYERVGVGMRRSKEYWMERWRKKR